jgi:hypothetical protein
LKTHPSSIDALTLRAFIPMPFDETPIHGDNR